MAGIFNNLFNANIFNGAEPADGPTPPPPIVIFDKTGTGGIDGGDAKRRRIVKPTGLLDRPKRKDIEERVDDSREIEAEIADRLAREFVDDVEELVEEPPIEQMTMAQIDLEIGVRLRKKLKQEEEEIMAMLMLAAMV